MRFVITVREIFMENNVDIFSLLNLHEMEKHRVRCYKAVNKLCSHFISTFPYGDCFNVSKNQMIRFTNVCFA